MTTIINFITKIFSKDYWVKEIPEIYHDECFMCNNSSTCEGCPYL